MVAEYGSYENYKISAQYLLIKPARPKTEEHGL